MTDQTKLTQLADSEIGDTVRTGAVTSFAEGGAVEPEEEVLHEDDLADTRASAAEQLSSSNAASDETMRAERPIELVRSESRRKVASQDCIRFLRRVVSFCRRTAP